MKPQTSNIVCTMPFWNKLHKLLLNSLDWSATLLDKQERDTIVFFLLLLKKLKFFK